MKIAVIGATGMIGRQLVGVLEAGGHDVVAVSRSAGVDVVTGEGLAAALTDVEAVIDVSNAGTIDQTAATEFFTTAARNLQEAGAAAGVRRIVVLSILNVDRFTAGYMVAKAAHEQAALAGSVPVTVLRASQFHEFADQTLGWGRQGDVSHVPQTRTQPIAARTVAEELAALATGSATDGPSIREIAGPQEEQLVDMAARLAARRGEPSRVEGAEDPSDPDRDLVEAGAFLAGPDTKLAGPTFQEWLETSA